MSSICYRRGLKRGLRPGRRKRKALTYVWGLGIRTIKFFEISKVLTLRGTSPLGVELTDSKTGRGIVLTARNHFNRPDQS